MVSAVMYERRIKLIRCAGPVLACSAGKLNKCFNRAILVQAGDKVPIFESANLGFTEPKEFDEIQRIANLYCRFSYYSTLKGTNGQAVTGVVDLFHVTIRTDAIERYNVFGSVPSKAQVKRGNILSAKCHFFTSSNAFLLRIP